MAISERVRRCPIGATTDASGRRRRRAPRRSPGTRRRSASSCRAVACSSVETRAWPTSATPPPPVGRSLLASPGPRAAWVAPAAPVKSRKSRATDPLETADAGPAMGASLSCEDRKARSVT
jgi:hypothetical protein